jgi:endoglucanase
MHRLLIALIARIACLLMLPVAAFAQLPSPTYGWNLGNTLEPPSGEGTWGPAASQGLINAVADAGFNTIRLPVAWDSHANQSTYQIDAVWMARVKQVVDWCYARDLHVVLNVHWDNGWLENNITDTVNPTINAKMRSYWTQIATTFAGYDDRLIFAGANEPACDTGAQWSTLRTYYDTFIDAVRATGGNNASRWLVVQGPGTDIDRTDQLVSSLPTDPTPGRLAMEVHYYAPFQWCLMNQDETWGKMFYFWGQGYHHATRADRNASWGEEAYVDAQFQRMADKFIRQGVPVILGEFQAFKRTDRSDLTGADYNLHVASRTYFHKYIVDSANRKGLKPIYWDQAGQMFNWSTGAMVDSDNAQALTGGAALPPPSACAGSAVSIGSITVAAVSAGQGKKRGQATATVVNNCGDPVAGATVTGSFTGTINQSGVSAVTNSSGVAVLQTSSAIKGTVNVTFCVSGIIKTGLAYNASSNAETCDRN